MAPGGACGLSVRVGTDLVALADDLADGIAHPDGPVLEPELVVVPTPGIGAWLAGRLASRLGATTVDGAPLGDGVCANVQLRLVGDLLRRLDAERADEPDPWSVGAMTVAALGSLVTATDTDPLGRLRRPEDESSAFAVARSCADLFDQLFRWRPDVADRWLEGDEEDPRAALLRRLAARAGSPPPHHALDAALWRLAGGDDGGLDLPARVHLFGADTLAGGPRMPAVLDAIGTVRDVRVHLVVPSTSRFESLRASTPRFAGPAPERRRGGDDADALLRSWGTATGDAARLVAQLPARSTTAVALVGGTAAAPSTTLLGALQRRVTGEPSVPRAADATVALHGCVGPLRQVEVCRDAILHALADDPTLVPSDVVVLCADLPRFAPYVDAVLGDPQGAPVLPYVVRDRAVSRAVPRVAALDAALRLLAGRVARSGVLEFLRLATVQARFGLDADDVDRIATWSSLTDVHWGLDAAHRRAAGLADDFDAGTWRRALDRLLAGVALPDGLGASTLALRAVDVGHSLERVGALCEFTDALATLRADAVTARPVSVWCAYARQVTDAFLSTSSDTVAACRALDELLESIEDDAVGDDAAVSFLEFRSLYADRAAQVRDLVVTGTGGVTVTSFAPLRNVPFRVVAILGLDESSLERGRTVDVSFGAPRVGDRDPRTELRAALLAAVLAARDHLIVTYESRDVTSNEAVAPATVLAELREALERCGDGDLTALVTEHPRHGHGDADLRAGGRGPFGFDRGALSRALELRDPLADEASLRARLEGGRAPSSRVRASELTGFLVAPQREYLRATLGIRLPPRARVPDDELPTSLDDLDRALAVGALVEFGLTELDSGAVDTADWLALSRGWAAEADGPLAALPGRLRERELVRMAPRARELRNQVVNAWRGETAQRRTLEVEVGDEVVVAEVDVFEGSRTVRWRSTTNELRIRVLATVDALCLTAASPEVRWRAMRVYRRGEKARCESFTVPGEDADERRARALEALGTLLGLRRRGLEAPIPLFFNATAKMLDKLKPGGSVPSPDDLLAAGAGGWAPYHGPGDATEDAVRYCFDATYEELCDLEVRDGDPVARLDHGGSRLLAYSLALADGLCVLDDVGTAT